jgi:hypothetical protein
MKKKQFFDAITVDLPNGLIIFTDHGRTVSTQSTIKDETSHKITLAGFSGTVIAEEPEDWISEYLDGSIM